MIGFVRSRPHRCGRAVALLLTVFLSGCGSGLAPVEGIVVWKDGTPAKEIQGSHVIFDLPEQQTSARGFVGADGTFRLTTTNPEDGAMPGEYKVIIIEANRKPLGGPDASQLAPAILHGRYADRNATDLKVSVKPGRNQVKLMVEKAKK